MFEIKLLKLRKLKFNLLQLKEKKLDCTLKIKATT